MKTFLDKLYTWQDVKRVFQLTYPNDWYENWFDIDVYGDIITITLPIDYTDADVQASEARLQELFGPRYRAGQLSFDYLDRKMTVEYEEAYEEKQRRRRWDISLPLFKELHHDVLKPAPFAGAPVIAFHSYKGGVGRTLSLLAFVHEMSVQQKRNGQHFRLLIVDGDIEAPGLTTLAKEQYPVHEISFLDTLALIHSEKEWRQTALPFIAKKVKEQPLRIPVDGFETTQYFLSTYRDTKQVMALPVTPEHLVHIRERQWIIGDFLSELGKELGVDAVIVDLRTGISEFSAPLLFDPRIQKLYVTSTSMQSVAGMDVVVNEVYRGKNPQPPAPIFLVSMTVENEIGDSRKGKIKDQLLDVFTQDEAEPSESADVIPEEPSVYFLPFAEKLVHLDGLDSIGKKLQGTGMSEEMQKVVEQIKSQLSIDREEQQRTVLTEDQRTQFLDKLHKLAEKMEVAETDLVSNFLITSPLNSLAQKYRYEVPRAVILGAKGTGKTFAFLQMILAKTWEQFVVKSTLEPEQGSQNETYIFPFFKPRNLDTTPDSPISQTIAETTQVLGFQRNPSQSYYYWEEQMSQFGDETTRDVEWKAFWINSLLKSTGLDVGSLEELNAHLQQVNKRMIFVLDGLEDWFFQKQSHADERSAAAIRALCQNLINEWRSYPNSRVGILVCVRADLVQTAIVQNYRQFHALHQPYELKWTHTEALRLVLWMAQQCEPTLLDTKAPIEKMLYEKIEHQLYQLWGVKLGNPDSNEAYTATWILGALSDLKGQLTARDMVRFLRFAAQTSMKNTYWTDRYLAPIAIREAMKGCSEKKIEEIKQEVKWIVPIFAKFEGKSRSERHIPFQKEQYDLTRDDIDLLEQHGYLVELKDGYYLPEIISHGLGFTWKRRGRRKVIGLIDKRKS